MKCLVKRKPEVGIWMETQPIPACGPNDVLVKVNSTSICGTDLHIYNWDAWSQATVPVPLITGHEFAGTIAAIGSNVATEGSYALRIGERVSGEGHITCGGCRNCRAGKQHLCRNTKGIGVNHRGAFAEYVALPAANCFRLPNEISDRIGSSMDPLGNAVHTALAYDLIGEDVLIIGAGPIGCMAAAICKHVGARYVVVTDINDYRLDLALQCGADMALNVAVKGEQAVKDAIRDLGMNEGFDVGLEMSGHRDGINMMVNSMNNGGRLALLGLSPSTVAVEWNTMVLKGLQMKGIYGREMFETWYKMRNMLMGGLDKTLAPVYTHTFPIDDFQKGFDVMVSGQCGKVELTWN